MWISLHNLSKTFKLEIFYWRFTFGVITFQKYSHLLSRIKLILNKSYSCYWFCIPKAQHPSNIRFNLFDIVDFRMLWKWLINKNFSWASIDRNIFIQFRYSSINDVIFCIIGDKLCSNCVFNDKLIPTFLL